MLTVASCVIVLSKKFVLQSNVNAILPFLKKNFVPEVRQDQICPQARDQMSNDDQNDAYHFLGKGTNELNSHLSKFIKLTHEDFI